jgi:VanZ family protein
MVVLPDRRQRLASRGTGSGSAAFLARFWLPVGAYVSLIFFLSAQPGLQPPLHFQNSDKLSHLLEYGGLGLLLVRALRASLPARRWAFVVLLTLGIGLGIAAGDEYFQSFVPDRDSSVFDWLADGTGLTFAQLAFLALAREPEA